MLYFATRLDSIMQTNCRPTIAVDLVQNRGLLRVGVNYFIKTMVLGRGVLCHPIDEQRRTRAIGVLQIDVSARPVAVFHPDVPLLVEADDGQLVSKTRSSSERQSAFQRILSWDKLLRSVRREW